MSQTLDEMTSRQLFWAGTAAAFGFNALGWLVMMGVGLQPEELYPGIWVIWGVALLAALAVHLQGRWKELGSGALVGVLLAVPGPVLATLIAYAASVGGSSE